MAHTYTWDKLVKNAYRLNPKTRGPNSRYTPKFEVMSYTSGPNRGQRVIVPYVGTKSVLISLRAWGVTQASLHNVTLLFSQVDIQKEDPKSTNYFQIQYEGQMYWIHKLDKFKHPLTSRCTCFTEDTKVLLSNGTFKTFKELEGETNFEIISYNEEEDKFEIVKAYNCGKKKENAELLRITLDNGKTIDCTLDHRFLTRQGLWIEAKDLQQGDSLRALYMDKNDLERLLPNGKKEIIKKHQSKSNFCVYVYLDPRYPGYYSYKSCSFNFKPIYVSKGINNEDFNPLNIDFTDNFQDNIRELIYKGLSPIVMKQSISLEEKVANKIEQRLIDEIGLEVEGKGPLLNYRYDNYHKNLVELYNQEELLIPALQNHKVIKVEKLQKTKDVYCLSAEYLGNFVVSSDNEDSHIFSGVVVENCADEFFTWALWKYNAGCLFGPKPKPYQRKTQTYPQRNPQHLVGVCKHVTNAWTVLRDSGLTMN